MTNKPIRIGTRDSILATWQARHVEEILKTAGYATELRYIKTEGDRVIDTPLPLMGGKGVFTKALDDALLAGEIDLAVHSLKDIPTRQPEGLMIGAVSDREDTADVLVTSESVTRKPVGTGSDSASVCNDSASDGNDSASVGNEDVSTRNPAGGTNRYSDSDVASYASKETFPGFLSDPLYKAVIASSSNRRIGQWLARYPRHRITDIRGNIQTRLRKLSENSWDGAIFAAAGLRRLGLEHHIHVVLDWMLPAPAQGAMGVMVREDDTRIRESVMPLNNPDVALCTTIERDVLHTLEGGCSAPVGALAVIENGTVRLKVNTVYPDGTGLIQFEMSRGREHAEDLGKQAAEEALNRGAGALIRDFKKGITTGNKQRG